MSRVKLDVIAIVGEALAHTFSNVWPALRASAMWLVVLICIGGVLTTSVPFSVSPEGLPQIEGDLTGGHVALILGCALMLLVVMSASAAGWHRFVILGERPPIIPVLDINAFRYAAYNLLLSLIWFIIYIIAASIFTVFTGQSAQSAGGILAAMLGAVGSTLLVNRLGLTLPSAALGQRMRLKESWDITEGNTARIFLIFVVAQIAIILPREFLIAVISLSAPLQILGAIVGLVSMALWFALWTGALSRIYMALTSPAAGDTT
jgi:hypothetical protein